MSRHCAIWAYRQCHAVQSVILQSAALVSCNELIKAKIHYTSFPAASPQQVSNSPVASFPQIHYISFPVASP